MKITAVTGDITKLAADAVIVNLFEGVKRPSGATAAVDKALGGAIAKLIKQGEIKGKRGEITLIHTMDKIKPARVLVAGLGSKEQLTPAVIREAIAEACRYLRKMPVKEVVTIAHGTGAGGIDATVSAQAITEGAMLGSYTFRWHKTKSDNNGEIERLSIATPERQLLKPLKKGCEKGRVLAEATILARDVANEPGNFMTPTDLAAVAAKVADDWGLECEVFERADMEEMDMGALLGVARGSVQPPKLIVLKYRGDKRSKKIIGLVGKGLTFDSGGISIKPSEKMGDMKGDMAGGAAVIAAMRAIGELKPKANVTAIVPATENLPDGNAYKPGDVLKASNGKTIEVVNTDAEGRLILADALSYARKLGLSPVIDIATLTGACMVALGDLCSGGFGNDQGVIDKVIAAGADAGERIWQLPMCDEYKEANKSDIADVKNSGGRYGGAITAAQFLHEFIEDTPWAHIDIAGTSRSEKDKGYVVKGETGVMVRTLVNFVLGM
ncbi:MAG: leucyl aminopeptidase [Chloroflexota bacterium]|nr:leucyl aminopeptidase [Chloroflexota bacterium]